MFAKAKKSSGSLRRRALDRDDEHDRNVDNAAEKVVIKKEIVKKPGLSFGDDEAEGEEFIVKKGKQGLSGPKKSNQSAQRVAPDFNASSDLGLQPSSWKKSSIGLYSAEGLAELRKKQPFQFGCNRVDSPDASHLDVHAVEKDPAEPNNVVLAGDEAAFIEEYESQVGVIEDIDGITSELRNKKDGELMHGSSKRRVKLTDVNNEEFIPFDDSTSLRQSSEVLVQKMLYGNKLTNFADDLDDEVQTRWESEQVSRGSSFQFLVKNVTDIGSGNLAAEFDSDHHIDSLKKALTDAMQSLVDAIGKGERTISLYTAELQTAETAFIQAKEKTEKEGLVFEKFQQIRQSLGIFCGMVREKEEMISRVREARIQIAEEQKSSITKKYHQMQELQIIKFRRESPGAIESLGSYTRLKSGPLESNDFGRLPMKSIENVSYPSYENETETIKLQMEKRLQTLFDAADLIFEDVNESVASLKSIKMLMEDWKRNHGDQYARAFCTHSLPDLFAPHVLLETVRWNPAEASVYRIPVESNGLRVDTIFEHFEWFRTLFDFAAGIPTPSSSEYQSENDPDADLIPRLMNLVVAPFLNEMIDKSYNAISTTETDNYVGAINELSIFGLDENKQRSLAESPVFAIRDAASAICVPIAGPIAADSAGIQILEHCFQNAFLIMRNIYSWNEIVGAGLLMPISLSTIAGQKLVPALQRLIRDKPPESALAFAIRSVEHISSMIPEGWRNEALYPELANELLKTADRIKQVSVSHGNKVLSVKIATAVESLRPL